MKKAIYLLAGILSLVLFSLPGTAQGSATGPANEEQNDSAANAACIKALQTKRDSLSAIIKKEDAKRNTQLNGVSAEVLEEMNDRQDSVCLDLRSQLVDVQLEIWERSKGTLPTQLKQQLNAGKK
jgi:hypothetical protein